MAHEAVVEDARWSEAEATSPYYVEEDGVRFAGTHLLLDMWGGVGLDDVRAIEAALTESVAAAGATLLKVDLHQYSSTGGVSGVAILAESHMSIHTWPETGYAAIDIFVCGACDAEKAVPVLRAHFRPTDVRLTKHRRGLRP